MHPDVYLYVPFLQAEALERGEIDPEDAVDQNETEPVVRVGSMPEGLLKNACLCIYSRLHKPDGVLLPMLSRSRAWVVFVVHSTLDVTWHTGPHTCMSYASCPVPLP